jgi:hypothetical protein
MQGKGFQFFLRQLLGPNRETPLNSVDQIILVELPVFGQVF